MRVRVVSRFYREKETRNDVSASAPPIEKIRTQSLAIPFADFIILGKWKSRTTPAEFLPTILYTGQPSDSRVATN